MNLLNSAFSETIRKYKDSSAELKASAPPEFFTVLSGKLSQIK